MTEARTMTLTDFLLERIAEDEQRARDLDAAYERDEPRPPARLIGFGALVIPARVLAECEAKRRIVEEYRMAAAQDPRRTSVAWGRLATCAYALATIYADHPDYREEWRP